jgi:small subunit ribosomal protein S6
VQTAMNKYELAIVVNAKIEDEARGVVVDSVKDLVTKYGGTITEVEEPGKKRLAYEIQKMKEGYYYFIHFDSPSTTVLEVESRVRIMDNVLRFLCIRRDAA